MISEKNTQITIIITLVLVAGLLTVFCCSVGKDINSKEVFSTANSSSTNKDLFFENLKVNFAVLEADEKDSDYFAEKIKEKIDDSISYSDSNAEDSLKKELFFILRDPKYSYSGPVNRMYDFSVSVFKMPTDPFLSDSSYLSREYAVRYNISVYPESNGSRTDKTIWWYEKDASAIVKNVYGTQIGSNVAIIIISFYNEKTRKSTTFVLKAEDIEKIKTYLKENDNYIRYYDWSQIITDDIEIIYYEEPFTGINIAVPELASANLNDKRIYDENLKSLIKSQSFELMDAVERIKRSIQDGKHQETLTLSENLIQISKEFREELENYSKDESSAAVIKEYLEGLSLFSMAGSYYWDKSFIPGEISDENTPGNLLEGINKINTVLEYFGEQEYDTTAFQIPEVSLYSDYLPAGTAFHYKDNAGNNDISIRITDYYLRERIIIKDSTNSELKEVSFGKLYLGVVAEVVHMGYRGGGYDKIKTPALSSYTLYYNGEEYKPFIPGSYILDLGQVYTEKTLSRREKYESILFFEIKKDSSFYPDKGYVTIDLGNYGNRMWSLSNELKNSN